MLQFSLLQIRNLAEKWHLSCKPRMRSTSSIPIVLTSAILFSIENVHRYHKKP